MTDADQNRPMRWPADFPGKHDRLPVPTPTR